MPQFGDASVVLVYWSVRDEVPTHDFIGRWHGVKRIALPTVISGTELELREYDPACMQRGAFGIMEPGPGAVKIDPSEIDFAIIPGEAFDADGNRKGHGRGYYDRLLPKLRCMKVGISPASRIVEKLEPAPWDAPVDLVICSD